MPLLGERCKAWNARVDKLTAELSGIFVRSTDARADAIGRLATLLDGNGERVKAIVTAFDPIVLPIFLEFGSIVFFAVAFGKRQRLPERTEKPLRHVHTRDAALTDFRRLKGVGAQKVLAARWAVSEGTVSKWLTSWENAGLVTRNRFGKQRTALIAHHSECRQVLRLCFTRVLNRRA